MLQYEEEICSSSESEEDRLYSPVQEQDQQQFRQEKESYLFTEQFDIIKWSQIIKQEVKVPQKKAKKNPSNPKKAKPSKSNSVSPQKRKKTTKTKPKMKDIKPINLELEKSAFFMQKCAYNPQFEYTDQFLELFQEQPHRKYEGIALRILDSCIKEYGTEQSFTELEGGRILTLEETEQCFKDYITKLGVQDLISYEFQENTVAPTSVVHSPVDGKSKVIIGLPINYRVHRMEGVLNHEIGTHFIRKINDRQQVWFKRRGKYHLEPYLKHEEGLAVINQMLPSALKRQSKPYFYMAALHYISAILSSQMSFAQLFYELRYFIQDESKRYRECLRVKRGMRDTSQPGGMYKDQVYLKGAIKILKMRQKLNFVNFHCGKLTVKDCLRLTETNQISTKNMYHPHFLSDMEQYRRGLDVLAQFNFLS